MISYFNVCVFIFSFWAFLADKQEEVELNNSRPNIILIMSDDQGWGDAGYQGHPELKTPHLDQMATDGLVFNRFYAAAPVCSPTRGSVLTGRHPFRYGITFANVGHIPAEELLLPEILKEKGYTTGHFGKWHLGTMDKNVVESNRGGYARNLKHYSPPWENGYDASFATESKVPTWDPMINCDTAVSGCNQTQNPGDSYGTYYWTGPGQITTENLVGDDSRVIMDRVVPFVEKAVESKTPFFSTIWFHTPHSPVVAGPEYLKMYNGLTEKKQHYYGCITAMDEQIGRLRAKLKELGVADNTMIWFCSDNGPAAAGGGPGMEAGQRQQGSTAGLRGRKGTLFEGGVRVPGILVWPAKVKSTRKTDFPAVTSDYLPTILDLLGINQETRNLDGISLKRVIENEEPEYRINPIGFQSRFRREFWQVWHDHDYKLMVEPEKKQTLLFNLKNDPNETNNLANKQPEVVLKMQQELDKWLLSVEQDRMKSEL